VHKIIILISLILSIPHVFAKKNPVVATVDGQKIKLSDVEKNYQSAKLFVTSKVVTRNAVLDELINRELGIKKAKDNKLAQDPTVKRKMEDILYHAQISKDLEGDFKKITIENSEIKAYYNKYPEYRTAHILLRVRANPSENELKAVLNQSMKIYNEIRKSPKKFAELAGKYSQSPNAEVGGDIGYQPAVRLAPEYFNAIKGKAPGHITTPVRTQYGIHIIKMIGVRNVQDISNALYKKIIYDKKRDSVITKYFQRLRKKASIKIEKKYLR